jgi:RNAse (barnase) inhibitor barstar
MPIYHKEPENDSAATIKRQPYQSFSCSLLHCGPIALYYNKQILENDINKLVSEQFDIRRLNASIWRSDTSVHEAIQNTLGFPSYYGKNLNALRDCLSDLDIADNGGMSIVLTDFDDFSDYNQDFAECMLDIFARSSHRLQIFGKTLIVMVHTKDPDASFGNLGAITAWWNTQEFQRNKRIA